jgi:hypothetical protein
MNLRLVVCEDTDHGFDGICRHRPWFWVTKLSEEMKIHRDERLVESEIIFKQE